MNPSSVLTHVVLIKKRGETPLEALEAWKEENPEYMLTPASYAGRLDPMAEGKLLILLGEECKKQQEYTGLDKEYEIKMVLDLSTDTGDTLGLPAYAKVETHPTPREIAEARDAVQGPHTVPYPIFSSKPVAGQPLFMYALANTLSTIQIPTHTEIVYNSTLIQQDLINTTDLHARINETLALVPRSDEPSKELGADFRQDEIRAAWEELFAKLPDRKFSVLTLRVTCASGTYMRTLAERIGRELGSAGFALSINRTRIGTYRPLGKLGLWTKEY